MLSNRSSADLAVQKKITGKRIAFLGGAFDPPHPGHEMLARQVLALDLTDQVLWVPSWSPPHKNAGKMSSFEHRLAMTELAARSIPGCAVSDIEARKKFDPSYSYKVLSALAEENPGAELQLLIGQDSLEQLHSWYCARELVREYTIIAFPRRGEMCGGECLTLPISFWGRIWRISCVAVWSNANIWKYLQLICEKNWQKHQM